MSFEDIELILVDDKSTDNSKEIIDFFVNKYSNIKSIFLDSNSGGGGIPRNIGIENASAPFLMFLDSDDELLDDVCEILYNKMTEDNYDFVTGNAIAMINGIPHVDIDYKEDNREIIIPSNHYDSFKPFRAWGTLYNKDFLINNNIYFLETACGEDTYFVNKCFFNANRIAYLDNYYGLIYYIRNKNSITSSLNKRTILGSYESFSKIKKMLLENNIVLTYDPFLIVIYYTLSTKWNVSKNEEFEIYKDILNYKNQNYFETKLPFYYKIMDWFLENNHFLLAYYYHKFCYLVFGSKFFQKFSNNKKKLIENFEVFNKFNIN